MRFRLRLRRPDQMYSSEGLRHRIVPLWIDDPYFSRSLSRLSSVCRSTTSPGFSLVSASSSA